MFSDCLPQASLGVRSRMRDRLADPPACWREEEQASVGSKLPKNKAAAPLPHSKGASHGHLGRDPITGGTPVLRQEYQGGTLAFGS